MTSHINSTWFKVTFVYIYKPKYLCTFAECVYHLSSTSMPDVTRWVNIHFDHQPGGKMYTTIKKITYQYIALQFKIQDSRFKCIYSDIIVVQVQI